MREFATRPAVEGATASAIRVGSRAVVVALLLVAAATLVKAILTPLTGGDVAYLPLVAAVAIAARYEGAAAGALVGLAGAIVDAVLFLAPVGSVAIANPALSVRLVLFLPTALFLSVVIGQLGVARQREHAAARRWRTLLDGSPDATLLIRRSDGEIVYANHRWEELGWRADELAGRTVSAALPTAVPLIQEAGTDAGTAVIEAPDGREVHIELLVAPVDLDDDGPGWVVSARDAGERIAAQTRLLRLAKAERARASELSAIIGSVDDAVAVLDADGAVVLANDALGGLAGSPVRDADQLRTILGLPADASLSSDEPTTHEVRLEDPVRWLEVRTLPIGDGEHDDAGQLVLVRDVTGEREARAAREAFIGVLSHELRTPITTILGLATLLNRPSGTLDLEQRRDVVADIAGEAERLHHLIEDLLVLSRSERSELRLDPEPVLVRHAIDRVVDAERRRYPHVRFVVVAPPGLPPVGGDRTFVEQVLRNLVGNAAKYSPTTATDVEVVAAVEGRDVTVRVLDRGPGFDPDDRERLFEIFFRSERTARQRAGAGIGLYVTRSLVRVMGGRVWAMPREGGGSEFGFALPIVSSADDDTDEATRAADVLGPGDGSRASTPADAG